MARYKNVDNIINELENCIGDTENSTIRLLDVFELIENAPTEDVVPKSDVEKLQQLLDVYKQGCGEISITENGGIAGLLTIVIGSRVMYLPKEFVMLVKQAKQEVVRDIIDIIDYITGAEYDNHNEVEVAFMRGAKKVRSEIVKKYHIDEKLVTKDKRNT